MIKMPCHIQLFTRTRSASGLLINLFHRLLALIKQLILIFNNVFICWNVSAKKLFPVCFGVTWKGKVRLAEFDDCTCQSFLFGNCDDVLMSVFKILNYFPFIFLIGKLWRLFQYFSVGDVWVDQYKYMLNVASQTSHCVKALSSFHSHLHSDPLRNVAHYFRSFALEVISNM